MSRSLLLKGIAGKLSILMGTAVLASASNAAASVPSLTADTHNDSIRQTAAMERKQLPEKLTLKQQMSGFKMIASHGSHSSHASHASHSSHSSHSSSGY